MFKSSLSLVAATLLALPLWAQEVELQPDHPDRYVVEQGDTLWDISERFLRSPWMWPEIWQANPQIDNPHLIFPGDVINLVYVDGEPRLSLERGPRPTEKWGPRVRDSKLDGAIHSVPLERIRPFLERPRILGEDDFDKLPYVVATREQRLVATAGENIYVRRLDAQPGDEVSVVRPSLIYRDVPPRFPWETSEPRYVETEEWELRGGLTIDDLLKELWTYVDRPRHEAEEILGYEVIEVGTAVVQTTGDPAILTLTSTSREVMEGDMIMPLHDYQFDTRFFPRAPDQVPYNTRVVALHDALYASGKYQIVAISRGSEDGVEAGHVFSAWRPGETIKDRIMYPPQDLKTFAQPRKKEVTLPDEYSGTIMVFRTFDRISYAIVTGGQHPVRLYDKLLAP